MKVEQKNIKKLFRTLGSCSQTYFYILNREFDHPKVNEERAADPLAGGIYRLGYQCGMLWGAALAIGAEAYRRFDDLDKAIAVAVSATQHVMKSFLGRAKSIECYDIVECDWSSKMSMAKYFFTGKFMSCFNLAEKWAPEAVDAAIEGLSHEQNDLPGESISCAAETAKKMGASDEETVMVAAFAGGLGLSDNACGALSASIWMKALTRIKSGEKSSYKDPNAEETLERFYEATDYKILCSEITGRSFDSMTDHTEFIKKGGCENLINALVG